MLSAAEIRGTVVAAVERYAAKQPDSYAGYVDAQSYPYQVIALFTGRPERHHQAILQNVAFEHYFAVRRVQRSLKTLTETLQRVEAAVRAPGGRRHALGGLGIDIPGNRVYLEVWRPTPDDVEALTERYGGEVAVVPIAEERLERCDVLGFEKLDERRLRVRYRPVHSGFAHRSAVTETDAAVGISVSVVHPPWEVMRHLPRSEETTDVELCEPLGARTVVIDRSE